MSDLVGAHSPRVWGHRVDAKEVVDLLSFVPEPQTGELARALTELGFDVAVLGESALEVDTVRSRPLVLFVGRGEVPHERLPAFLAKKRGTPILGVFERASFPSHRGTLSRCSDFLAWPPDHGEVALRLRRAGIAPPVACREEAAALRRTFARLKLLGGSPAFLQVLELIRKFGRSEAPVLVQGQTGTGKELAARSMHYLGPRRDHPFVPVNCGALPDNLVENELFGHERGAFTDAKSSQPGLVAQADGGTLFLDEVEGLSPRAQIALLRFLQDHEYKPLGGSRVRKADVRIISATHERLQDLVDRGEFRQDLLFRLNVLMVRMPPLAARPGDVELLARYFIRRHSRRYQLPAKGIHPLAMDWMNAHGWPGNVRELENLVHRAFVLCDGPVIELRHLLQAESGGAVDADAGEEPPFPETFQEAKARIVERFEKQYLSWLMQETCGNVTLAAQRAGKERRSLGKLLKKHGIRKSRYVLDA